MGDGLRSSQRRLGPLRDHFEWCYPPHLADAPKDDDKLPELEADARFKALVGNLVNTPHKPHKPSVDEQPRDRRRASDNRDD